MKMASKAEGGRGHGGGGRTRTRRNDSTCTVIMCLWSHVSVCVVYREGTLVATMIFNDRRRRSSMRSLSMDKRALM